VAELVSGSLRWLVGRGRSLTSRALGAASPLVAGRLASAALTFALPLFLARLLTPTTFGVYKHFFLVAMTLQLTGQLGLTQSLYYFVPRGGVARGAYVTQTVLALILVAVTAAALLWCAAPLYGRWLGDPLLPSLRAPLALFAGLSLLAAPLEAALTADGRVGAAAVSYVLSDGARAAALVLGVLVAGPRGLFWAAALTALARVGALALLLATGVLPAARPSARRFSAQLAYALPFAGASYLYVAQRYLPSYAVSARFDAATFALFTVALFHMPVVDIVYTPISEVMMVQIGRALHRQRPLEARAAWSDAVRKLAAILFPAAACAWLFGRTLLPILFTHKYDGAVPLFLLATLEMPLWALPLDALLRAAGATRFLFGCYAARVVTTGLLVVGGIHLFGLRGAIGGALVSEALARLAMMLEARRFLSLRLPALCELGTLARLGCVAAGAALPARLASALPLAPLPSLGAGVAVYGVAYLALLHAGARRASAASLPATA
jgi:O-antigen/teichoic acid export membrane protein